MGRPEPRQRAGALWKPVTWGSRLGAAARSLLVQPRRFLGALTCTVAVVASAATMLALAPPGDASMLASIYGGLVAFNLLLFFPPGVLTGRAAAHRCGAAG